MMKFDLKRFVTESNRIEGIHRRPLKREIEAHEKLLAVPTMEVAHLVEFVQAIQPDAVLRERQGLNVRVGNHFPPPGGQAILYRLAEICDRVNGLTPHGAELAAHHYHHEYETLHPFTDGNGRSGRAFWLWMRGGIAKAPLGFLHHFYYEALAEAR